ncbi:MAG: hypothetical protein CHACPFDD_01502 [Phycisphaerae bacterium]|nr:hypothetical protein [Phycisphaerae bacterium]
MSEIGHTIGEPEELAALYAAGAMTGEHMSEFENHVRAGCERCRSELRRLDLAMEELYRAIEPVPPPAAVREALLARVATKPGESGNPQVWRDWPSDTADGGMLIRRAAEAAWEPVGIEGIAIRRLFVDRQRDQMTMLVRMAPGTAYPRHVHHGPEECLVLEGDLRVGDTVLRAGDYQRAAPDSQHGVQSTEGGCLLMIVSSLSDELI